MNKKILVVVLFLVVLVAPGSASAFAIKQLSNMAVQNDFILGPGKVELFLAPGETAVRELKITNRTGKRIEAKVEVEDFTGDSETASILLGEERGPYSLRDYILPEVNSFVLAHGEEARLPVTISIPADAQPGGLYGSVIISVSAEGVLSEGENGQEAKGNVSTISRLGTLFFVRVKGDVNEQGSLKSFSTDKHFYQKGPINFAIIYENTGNVHQTPYAEIKINNLLGKQIDKLDVSPWFVMPGFTRKMEVQWNKGLAFGRYTAELTLNRNYGNNVDKQIINFWIVPVKIILIAVGIILILVLLIVWFTSKFELKKKRD